MSGDILDLMADWNGDGVVVRRDHPTATWIFIAMHKNVLGCPAGGTRMKVYPTPADGLRDAMRLAEGMTYKWASLDMPYGGGKAVLAIPRPLADGEREGLLERYGELVESLRGTFVTGADLGTGPEAMAVVARRTCHVLGFDPEDGSSADPGPYTARGVLVSMKAALRRAFGSGELAGRSVLVEGLGDVGAPLARALAQGGARVLASDIETTRAEALARALGAVAVPSSHVVATACDVYAPCAVGATLNHESIPRLGCRIVAGSANNQLLEAEDAERLHQRGILYVPDYVGNAGGAMAFALMREGIRDPETLFERVEAIGGAVDRILEEATASDISPLVAAHRRVDRLLAEKAG